MKNKLRMLCIGYSAALAVTSTAFAAESTATSENNAVTTTNSEMNTTTLGRTSKASSLMGKDVKNLQGESLGEITDMIVDIASGRLVAVIISSGGFLGIGDVLSIVPPAALKYPASGEDVTLDVSKEVLASAPHFKSDEWPDLTKVDYLGSVYTAYNVAPLSDKMSSKMADNSERNVRDREGDKPTAIDQGNSKSDIDITAQIRKDIMDQENLSINAQNVKIITTDGRVTLRGPVKTAEEKRLIAGFATRATSEDRVDDQLEVE